MTFEGSGSQRLPSLLDGWICLVGLDSGQPKLSWSLFLLG